MDELKTTLDELGVSTTMLPDSGVEGVTLDFVVSLNHGEVLRASNGVEDSSSGFAATLLGSLPVLGDQSRSVQTSCPGPDCGAGNAKSVGNVQQDIPADLGAVEIAGANSVTKSLLSTDNVTALATLQIGLQKLLGKGGALELVGDNLRDLTDTVNAEVLPVVNSALGDAYGVLGDSLEDTAPEVKKQLDKLITTGTIKDIPDLSKVGLADLTVLGASATLSPKTLKGGAGLLSTAASQVADIDILGGWATIDSIALETSAFANGIKGGAVAEATSKVVGADIGGLLGIDLTGDDLNGLTNPDAVKEAILDAGKATGLSDQAEELVAAIDLLVNIAGISVEFFPTMQEADPKGNWARSSAGTLALTVEPKIPVIEAAGLAGVPRPAKYLSTGVSLKIELPTAASEVKVGDVLSSNPTTGVGTPLLAAVVLIGAAVVARRFALI
ncbi:MAG TPA: hypothetical protein VGB83_03495 [Actinomycetota bacterium]